MAFGALKPGAKLAKTPAAAKKPPKNTWEDFGSFVAPAPYVPTAADGLADSRNERFGNDMAWLDDMFKENPIDAVTAARELGTSADPGAQAAQRAAVDQFMGIAQGGGATAIERARRQKARGETENWLGGQRDADMQNLSERGMSGGGAEIAALLGDRQAAGQRMSQADLDTDAALEQRAIDALTSGSSLAGDMESRSNQFVQGNASLISDSAARTKAFLQDAYQRTMANRQSWDANVLNNQVAIAQGQQASGQQDNQYGYGSGTNTAGVDTAARNNAGQEFRGNTLGAYTGATPGVLSTQGAAYNASGAADSALFNTGVETAKTMTEMAAGGGGMGGGGAAAGGAGGSFWGQMGGKLAGNATSDKKKSLDPWG